MLTLDSPLVMSSPGVGRKLRSNCLTNRGRFHRDEVHAEIHRQWSFALLLQSSFLQTLAWERYLAIGGQGL